MPQRFRLDPRWGPVYLGLVVLGCAGRPPALLPAGLVTVEPAEVAEWVAGTMPSGSARHRFRWLYEDEKSAKGGRGSAHLAPPDTLRFDFAGSLGLGKGSALVIGDSAQWVVPERSVEELVPSLPLLWALFGIARPPAPGAELAGLATEGRTAWRYAAGPDTVDYLQVTGSEIVLHAEIRRAGKVVGRSRMSRTPEGRPLRASLSVPSVPAKLEITFYETVVSPGFPPDTWRAPAQ